jgi:hypothetical protein
MNGVLKYDSDTRNLKIEVEFDFPLENGPFHALMEALAALRAAIPLASLLIKQTAPEEYRYEFTSMTGKAWKQMLRVPADGSEASMTFDVEQYWKVSEFTPHREMRDAVINAIRLYKLTKIEGSWT